MIIISRKDSLYPDRGAMSSVFHEGRWLLISDIKKGLEDIQKDIPKKSDMLRRLQNADPLTNMHESLEPQTFEVSQLTHVTIRKQFKGILQDEYFKGSPIMFPLNKVNTDLMLSCWLVHIPDEQINRAKEDHFQQFSQKYKKETCSALPLDETIQHELRDMMANSPVFLPASRYGNYKFTFETKELLEEYRVQHCGGQQPVLRVLGTDLYALEIVHWVLIHSPDCREFDHLPQIGGESQGHAPFYRDVSGGIHWKPESMTCKYTFKIPPYGVLERAGNSYELHVWNYPGFAFHLPDATKGLNMGKSRLLSAVSACEVNGYGMALRHQGGNETIDVTEAFIQTQAESKPAGLEKQEFGATSQQTNGDDSLLSETKAAAQEGEGNEDQDEPQETKYVAKSENVGSHAIFGDLLAFKTAKVEDDPSAITASPSSVTQSSTSSESVTSSSFLGLKRARTDVLGDRESSAEPIKSARKL